VPENWRKLDEQPIRDGFRSLLSRRYELPTGRQLDFEIKLEGPTAVVLALTPENLVVLVREFRPGPEEWLLELPGGAVDDGEESRAAAARELLEETGYRGELTEAGTMVDCAYSTRLRHAFIARDCVQVQEPDAGEGEAAEVVLLSLHEFREHLRGGQLTDVGPAYLALDRLNLL
jgi:ADP-ribose pyrophosphatase